MFTDAISRTVLTSLALAALALLPAVELLSQHESGPVQSAIRVNSNCVPSGSLEDAILTLHLELRQGDWYPEADTGPSMKVYSFGEEGKALQIPAPLIRVPQGTEIRATIRNFLATTAVVHGMHSHPGDTNDVVRVPAGETREVHFTAGSAGTYQYWASAGGDLFRGRPYKEDSQLAGAFIVDPTGAVVDDRVFVIGLWQAKAEDDSPHNIPVINGKSWPYTERLTYEAGKPVRWRWINGSHWPHPMHMHGSYYRVDSAGDGERDEIFPPPQQELVVTRLMPPGTTMSTFWIPPAGRWIFHCHILQHISPDASASSPGVPPEQNHEHSINHMGGMVLGITITGNGPAPASEGRGRRLRLLVRERPASKGLPAGFSYQVEERYRLFPKDLIAPGPPLVLERGRIVEITIVNQLHEPTTVHWHGIELESYYDGVAGWGAQGDKVTPAIEPGRSFLVRFSPPRAGTFIYHTHFNDDEQLRKGLYGPLIVVEPGTSFNPETDRVFVISSFGLRDLKAPWLLNGSSEPTTLHWQKGQTYRLRLINITTAHTGLVSLFGSVGLLRWRALAKDGADLPAVQVVIQPAQQLTFAGETYDFEYRPEATGSVRLEIENLARHLKIVQMIEIR